MSTDVNVIMKYRRPADCWVCPECETENNILLAKCAVCTRQKDNKVRIISAWSEKDEVAETYIPPRTSTPPRVPVPPRGPVSPRGPVPPRGYVPPRGPVPPRGYAPPRGPVPSRGPIFRDDMGHAIPEKESGSSSIVWGILLAVIVFGIIFFFVITQTAYLSTVNGLTYTL